MKHAGIHWPENAEGEHPNRETIAHMPGMAGAVTICSPSARYHYDYVRAINPQAFILWRAIPRRGREPAKLGWNAVRVAEECLNLWDEQPHHGREWFCPLNELQFEKENGGPFPGYGEMALRLEQLRVALETIFLARNLNVGLVYPAWVPMHEGNYLEDWAWGAERWDAIGLHCYGSAEMMRERYESYRARFPNHLIIVKEWNANREGHDEREALLMWAEIARTDALFVGATYYIWETNNDNENMLSIWGNDAREYLFANPPTLKPEQPVSEPSVEEYQAYARPKIQAGGYDWETFRRQIQQESGWRHLDVSGAVKTSYTGSSKGICQLNQNFYGPELWRDPWTNLDTGIKLAVGYLKRFGSHRKALAAYNWGPSNVAGYKKANGTVVPPWDGRRVTISVQGEHYLDVILGPEWNEPGTIVAPPPPEEQMYTVGPGIANKMAEAQDEPATDELVGGVSEDGRAQYAMAFGKSGALYVYLPETNTNHRFQPD